MLYENYQKKINRIADILARILRLLPVIITAIAVMGAAVIGLLAAKGTISQFSCQSEIIYGDSLVCSAKAFLSDVRYEYRMNSEEAWVDGLPKLTGTYAVRAVSEDAFGNPRYGKEEKVVILPKNITVGCMGEMEYGDAPQALSQGTVGSDRIVCENFVMEPCEHGKITNEDLIRVMDVTPVQEQITVLDENGNDITFAYVIQAEKTEVSVVKRKLEIKVQDAEKIYDGTPLASEIYEFISGSLLEGERLVPTFADSLTNVGEIQNIPTFRVMNAKDEDVTDFYRIFSEAGKLTVNKRPVAITTGSLPDVFYSGNSVECPDFVCDPALAPIEGHSLILVSYLRFTEAGTHNNEMIFRIEDADGNDVIGNYDLIFTEGKITILPLPITVTTEDFTYPYDATEKISDQYAVSGTLLQGHTHSLMSPLSFINAGAYENALKIIIQDEQGRNVTSNYDVTYQYGTVTIEKMRITVTTESREWVYDGQFHDHAFYTVGGFQLPLENYDIQAEDLSTFKYVGTYENNISLEIKDKKTGEFVTQNFDIAYQYGILTIKPRSVTIHTNSGTWLYDGEEHYLTDYTVENGEDLVVGERFVIGDLTKIQNAGKVFNIWSDIDIVETDNNSVLDQYILQIDFGTLEILPRTIYIKPLDMEKVYDEIPLIPEMWEYQEESPYFLLAGHSLVVEYEGSQTDAGLGISKILSVRVFSDASNKTDVTENYNIQTFEGTLLVNPRPIQIKPKDEVKIYDGLPLLPSDWEFLPNGIYDLLEGHTLTVLTYTGSQTDAGVSNSGILSLRIMNGLMDAVDVTHNYSVEVVDGTLVVEPRPIHIKPANEEKDYDGMALVASRWEYTKDTEYTLLDSHTLVAEYEGSQYMPGTSDSDIKSVRIMNGMQDVTNNYDILFSSGTLTVYAQKIGEIKTNASQVVYLRQYSYLSYDGLYGTRAPSYSKKLPGGYTYDYLTSLAISGAGFQANTAELQNMIEYLLPYYRLGGSMTESDSFSGSLNTSAYAAQYYTVDILQNSYLQGMLPSQYQSYEMAYRQFVHDTYLTLDSETLLYMLELIDRQGFSLSDPEVIMKIASYIQKSAEYNLNYDKNMETENNIVIAFMEDYKEGVCRHYAAAATALYRALGIPARTAVGYMVETKAGEFVDIMTNTAHAWVEVYIDGIGWMQVEVTGGSGSSQIQNSFKVGAVKSSVAQAVYLRRASYGYYDGKTYTAAPVYSKKLPGGYMYDYLTSLAIEGAGFEPYSMEMKDMLYYLLPYYRGEGTYPSLESDAVNGFVSSSSYTLQYYSFDISEYEKLIGQLPEQYRAYERSYRNFVYDSYLYVDSETKRYMNRIISEQKFDISDPNVIMKIASYIQNAADYNLYFDREMESEDNVVIAFLETYKEGVCRHYAAAATLLYRALGIPARYTEGILVRTEKDEFTDITMPGHAWVEVYIDGIGWMQVEVTGGYGDDSFEKQVIEVQPEYTYKEYDGKPLYAQNQITGNNKLASLIELGYTYQVTVSGSQTQVGIGESKITSFRLFDPNGRDVTDEFVIRYQKGILEVLSRGIEVIPVYLYQLQKYYDGSPLAFEELDFEFDLPEDVRMEISLNISLTDVGVLTLSDLNADISEYATYRVYRKSDGADVTDDYRIVFQSAEATSVYIPIRVDRQMITVTAESQTKLYDGTPLTNGNAYVSFGFLADGHRMECITEGSITEIGETFNIVTWVVIYDRDGNDVTSNYDIETQMGELKIIDPND